MQAATACTPQEFQILPADQVVAFLEQMQKEQSRLLREQQDAIVARVLQTLSENGITCKDGPTSPTKLEQSLHSLVLHSLDESGLNYPHVQRSLSTSEQLAQTRPTPKSQSRQTGKTIVVSRCESIPIDTEEGLTSSEQTTGIRTHEISSEHSKAVVKHELVPSRIAESPLQGSNHRHESRRKKTRSHRRHRNERDDDNVTDEKFHSVRNKVGHKTLAILDRSRALLDEMKRLQTGDRARQSPTGTSNATFVDRMRKKVATAESPQEQARGSETDRITMRPHSSPSPPGSPTIHNADEKTGTSQPTQHGSPEETCEAVPATTNQHLDRPNPPRANIEILQAPVHSPENEDEWENELARQILTIYATSVKAKRDHNRPPSHVSSRGPARQRDPRPQLRTSCSLPAIHQTKPPTTAINATRQASPRRSPPRSKVQYSWEPSQKLDNGRVVVNMPKVPKPIWFAGTGAVKAVWCAIAEGFQGLHTSPSKSKRKPRSGSDPIAVCEHQLCEEVRRLEAKQQYTQCITTLETLIVSLVRARGVDSLESKLWKQLVVTCNAFASRCVDYKKSAVSLQLIKQAEHLIHNSILVDDTMRLELLAYLYDTYAHYYYHRGKSHAGLQYMIKAHEIHARQSSWAHIAKCRLHMANLLSLQSKHHEAMTHMASILELIEQNKLEDAGTTEGASAQKVCLAAVCYNNIAIEQLHLRQFEAASVSTGNAKRLAKLCLSYSNRWLAHFDATSNCVDLAIATLMEDVNASTNAAYKL